MAVNYRKDLRLLHVGYRKRDWDYVWYQPIINEDEGPVKDDPVMGLYTLTNGRLNIDRSPLEGEVCWFPPFDFRQSESAFRGERFKMQRTFLYDAWRYLEEEDPRRLRQLETELDLGRFSRWQAWFEHAMKWKRQQMGRRRARRLARLRAARRARQENGAAATAAAANEEQDEQLPSDDSAYESSGDEGSEDEEEDFVQAFRDFMSKKPSKTHANGNRRDNTYDSNATSSTNMPPPKRPRMPASRSPYAQASAGASSSSDLFMSGGLGQLTPEPTQDDVGLGSSRAPATAAKKSSKASSGAKKRGSDLDDEDAVNAANAGLSDVDAMAEAVRRSSAAPE